MRKIFVLFILFLLGINTSIGDEIENNSINFGGNKYNLLFSTKNPEFGGYLNEYFKAGETYHMWSEMVAVHHFPNAYSPIDQVKDFRVFLGSINCPSALTFDDKKNSAMIDFVMIDDSRLPVVLEFNIFKYQKSRKCGSMALQYAKRYVVKTAFETEAAKRDIEKNRKKLLNKVKHYTIPALVYSEIDKCKLADDLLENNNTKQPKIIEKSAEQKDADTETIAPAELQKFEYEDILGYEVITTYKKTFIPKVESDITVINEEKENTLHETAKEEVPQKAIVPKVSNNVLTNETIINYKDLPEFVHNNIDKIQEIKEKISQKENITDTNNKQVIQKTEKVEVKNQPQKEQKNKKVKKNKKNKNATYQVTNSKDDFYAKPLTKKEIKARKKQLKREHSQKVLKERAKKAAKNLER